MTATSPALQGDVTSRSDADGSYVLRDLPPGVYRLTFHAGARRLDRAGIEVSAAQVVRVDQALPSALVAEPSRRDARPPVVDAESTEQRTLVTRDMLRHLPLRGRSFEGALGLAPGAVEDAEGVAFAGSTSRENRYLVDGIDTTALRDGTVGTPLLREFVDEIRILSGGYQAEYGRATGAVVEVMTKPVSDELHGSAFASAVPFQVDRTPVRDVASSIERTVDRDFLLDLGGDLSGPLVRDRLWFYVGFAPELRRSTVTRIVQRQTDCRSVLPDGSLSECDPGAHMDGRPDEDPRTGQRLFEEVDRQQWKTDSQRYHFASKLLYRPARAHKGQLTFLGAPMVGQGVLGVDGAASATRLRFHRLPTDLGMRWRSKLDDARTEIEAGLGWHRDAYEQAPLDGTVLDTPTTRVFSSTLHRFGRAGGESAAVLVGCDDSAGGDDPYPRIDNCPVREYALDSPGFELEGRERRLAGRLALTHRARLRGKHVFKLGVDAQDEVAVDVHRFSGGRYFQLVPRSEQVRVYRYVGASGGSEICGADGDRPRACTYLDRATVNGRTVDWAAFAQDSWRLRPGLTIHAGVRYEEQRLRYAEAMRERVDPATGLSYGGDALTLRGLAPRAGVVHDPTGEGRSKVHASYGRYYPAIPMALNQLALSGTSLYGAFFEFEQCEEGAGSQDVTGRTPSPYACPRSTSESEPRAGDSFVTGTAAVAPGTKAQYMDEVVVGGEYELLEDVRVGVAIKQRSVGRALEYVSIDGGESYVLGNPGHFDAGEEARLLREIGGLSEGSPQREAAEARLEGFRRLRAFDEPRRDHKTIELVAMRRVTDAFYLWAAYNYSRTRGNYPGLRDPGDDRGELLPNRTGRLPQDRPHQLDVHGYYTFDLGDLGLITTGVRVRALSGTPIDTRSAEAYLLPRGVQGRTQAVTRTDVHLAYGRRLGGGVRVSGFVDLLNAFNQEPALEVDDRYTFDDVNAIVGGEPADLVFVKRLDSSGGETREPARRNVGYGEPVSRYAPLLLRIGARVTF